jgi:dolichol-phosphate mannosyltransferase
MDPARPLVVVPTYNEKDNVRPLVDKVFAALDGAQVLFVDDSSPDGTARAVETLAREHPGRVHLLVRDKKEGLGAAYCAGFAWGLARSYTHLLQMDADHSHDPADLPRLLAPVRAGDADFAIGSRYVKGGANKFSLARKLISMGGSLYARIVLGVRVRDLTGGFKCWRREVLETVDLSQVEARGFGFQIEMTYRAIKKGFRAVEVPITFHERLSGVSKMSGHIFFEALLMMWRLRWRVK